MRGIDEGRSPLRCIKVECRAPAGEYSAVGADLERGKDGSLKVATITDGEELRTFGREVWERGTVYERREGREDLVELWSWWNEGRRA